MNAELKLDQRYQEKFGKSVFKDQPTYNLYSRIGGESEKAHKQVRVLDGTGRQKEITEFDGTIISKSLMAETKLTRYYFLSDDDWKMADKFMRGR